MAARRTGEQTGGVDSIAWLDWPLLVANGLAGRSFHVSIARRPTLLTFPSEGSGGLARSPADPDRSIPRFPPPPLVEPVVKAHAYAYTSLGTPEGAVLVGAIRLRWHDAEFERVIGDRGIAQNFSGAVGEWLSVVRNWLVGWSGGVRGEVEGRGTPQVRLVLAHDPERGPFGAGGRPLVVGKVTVFGLNEVKGAFAAASLGMDLPLEHQLVADARLNHYQHEYRHAVINSCSAAEVALSRTARVALGRAGRSPDEINAIMRGVTGVVELYRLNAGRRGGLPISIGQVMSQLAGPRNEAAHAGEPLDEERSRNAFKTASALLKIVPLPNPGSLARRIGANATSTS